MEVLRYSDQHPNASLLLRQGGRCVSTNLPGGLATPHIPWPWSHQGQGQVFHWLQQEQIRASALQGCEMYRRLNSWVRTCENLNSFSSCEPIHWFMHSCTGSWTGFSPIWPHPSLKPVKILPFVCLGPAWGWEVVQAVRRGVVCGGGHEVQSQLCQNVSCALFPAVLLVFCGSWQAAAPCPSLPQPRSSPWSYSTNKMPSISISSNSSSLSQSRWWELKWIVFSRLFEQWLFTSRQEIHRLMQAGSGFPLP